MARLLLLFTSVFLLISCSSAQKALEGKTFSYMYWWYTFTYDYGNGGGRYYLQLSFDKKNVTIHDIHEWTEVLNEDENKEHSDTVRTLVVPYQTSSNIITVNSNIVPRLNVAGDTLIAPVISVETNGHPIESESAHFITE